MKVAVCQIVIKDDLNFNFNQMKKFILNASAKEADLVVFPESCLTGYLGISLSSLESLDLDLIHIYLNELSAMAKSQHIAIVTGQYLKRCGNWYNNVIFIGKDGLCKNSYDKCHLIDKDCYYVKPGEPPEVFNVENVNFMLGVCHDIRYAEHAMWGAIQGAQVYINPFYGFRVPEASKKTQEIYNSMLATRAVENGLYILGPNAANNEQMVRSQIRNPQGYAEIMSDTVDEDLLICDINPELAGHGWIKRRRSDLYTFQKTSNCRQSFFDKGYWQKEGYMINHDNNLLNYECVKMYDDCEKH